LNHSITHRLATHVAVGFLHVGLRLHNQSFPDGERPLDGIFQLFQQTLLQAQPSVSEPVLLHFSFYFISFLFFSFSFFLGCYHLYQRGIVLTALALAAASRVEFSACKDHKAWGCCKEGSKGDSTPGHTRMF
jgi:hypothetical protein